MTDDPPKKPDEIPGYMLQGNAEAKLPRRKMTIDDQALFIHQLKGRCVMSRPDTGHRGEFAAETWMRVTIEDIEKLDAIHQTLLFLNMHGVQDWIRGKLERRNYSGGGRR